MANDSTDRRCPVCAKQLVRKQRQFCSLGCRNTFLGARKRVEKRCVICGAPFTVARSNARRYSACSAGCMARRKQLTNRKRHATSLQPQSQAKRRATFIARRIATECGCGCGTPLLVPLNRMAGQRNGRVFLNRAHYEAWFRGEHVTHLWKGGDFPDYYGPTWPIQRRRALQRDLVCQECASSDDLVVHHIKHFRHCADYREANRLTNLVTLCRRCHVRVHLTGKATAAALP